MEINVSITEQCNHSPDKWSMKAVPQQVGQRYLLSIPTITCQCGAVANLTDAAGKRNPGTTLGVDFLLVAPQAPPITPPPQPKLAQAPQELEPGPGTELSHELQRLGISSCSACKGLAKLMNQWGPDECRNRMGEIVADVLPRARAWFDNATLKEKMGVWWNSDQRLSTALTVGTQAAGWGLDEALKSVIRAQVEAALVRWEAKTTK